MEKIAAFISKELEAAFAACGYDTTYAKATVSNRPDLCEYQCNGAMPLAKKEKKAPILIAEAVRDALSGNPVFAGVDAVKPGFLNLKINDAYLADYLVKMAADSRLGYEPASDQKTVIIDYGGPNVAKPLHVGHLRSAVIGESVKRIFRFAGHHVIGDVHLGDWGLQMGLIITELKTRQPGLVYFDEAYTGDYPVEAPFTVSELEEIYPTASKKSKEDAAYKDAAMQATFELQQGRRGYQALLSHILNVSVADLKKNYERLDVEFDLWKGESDAQPYIPAMVEKMKADGFAYYSEGALVVDVKEDGDTKEIPPCMILKSDGASLYNTTDLATIVSRMQDYAPDEIIYVVDKRQELYFTQIFRCAKKTGIAKPDTEFRFLGFGTMNGKDGKPFKTREGGVMRLETLVENTVREMRRKIVEGGKVAPELAEETSRIIALAAIKYGDLSNQASKDYIFDIDRFTSFEGNTGPYILYTVVRIKSILKKYAESGRAAGGPAVAAAPAGSPAGKADGMAGAASAGILTSAHESAGISPAGGPAMEAAHSASEKALMLELAKFNEVMETAYLEIAPHKICSYIYDLSNAFNRFYHDTPILGEEDERRRASFIEELKLTRRVLETCIDLLGFYAPERM